MKNIIKSIWVVFGVVIATGCAVHVGAYDADGRDLDSIFGGIEVDKGAKVGDVSSVNGGIEIGSQAYARNIETVNGGIDIGSNVTIESAETVNGSIESGKNLSVSKGLETVNGSIEVSTNGTIGGQLETVNGDIDLNNVIVGKSILTVNGDITLANSTRVEGDIVVEKSGGWFSSFTGDKITIRIDESSEVIGTIHLHKPAILKIAEGAHIGKIEKHYSRK